MLQSRWVGMVIAAVVLATQVATAKDVRERALIPGPWRFVGSNAPVPGAEAPQFDDGSWQQVEVPHTFADRTGKPVFCSAWYRTHLDLPAADQGRRTYLFFEGIATVADVYVNGQHLGQHRGAYTACIFDATSAIKPGGSNVLAVRVNNDPAQTADCLPSGPGKMLYHVYGGIYRKAWLIKAGAVHIDPEMASSGVYIQPRNVSQESAELAIRTLVRNDSGESIRLSVRHTVLDPDGKEAASAQGELALASGESKPVAVVAQVTKPQLWSTTTPGLYTVRTEIFEGETLLDALTQRTGIRTLRYGNGQFLLNGKPILVRGVNKHQETEHKLTAVADQDLVTDWDNLRDLGVNAVRLAHYPHARLEYDLADERGILVWAENGHSNKGAGSDTGDRITREMVRQNFNHPSIVCWSCGNEANEKAATRYAAVIREEDPSRLVTYGSDGQKPDNVDFIAVNTYPGWYRGKYDEFESPLTSEAGAGGHIASHTDYGAETHTVDRFEPEEYQQLIAEHRCQRVFRDKASESPMFFWWVFRDFGNSKYKGINTKGLLTCNNYKKDSFYLLQSFLRPDLPVVHLCGRNYFLRRGRADNGIKAYSNRPALTLTLNGTVQGERRNGEHRHQNGARVENVFFWDTPLRPGRNELSVSDNAGHSDSCVIYHVPQSGAPEDPKGLVVELKSSNANSPATWIERPMEAQQPFYCEYDGSADNTLDELPAGIEGAGWIATRRLGKPENRTDLSFKINPQASAATVFVLASGDDAFAEKLSKAGFAETGAPIHWRDNSLNLEKCRMFSKTCKGGEGVRIESSTLDYLVLVKKQ